MVKWQGEYFVLSGMSMIFHQVKQRLQENAQQPSNLKLVFIASGRCYGQCLRYAEKPITRWSHVACSYCCLHDKDGDGFLTEHDVDLTYEMYCGGDREQGGSECQRSEQREELVLTVYICWARKDVYLCHVFIQRYSD